MQLGEASAVSQQQQQDVTSLHKVPPAEGQVLLLLF
jgi:hypothetical protein